METLTPNPKKSGEVGLVGVGLGDRDDSGWDKGLVRRRGDEVPRKTDLTEGSMGGSFGDDWGILNPIVLEEVL